MITNNIKITLQKLYWDLLNPEINEDLSLANYFSKIPPVEDEVLDISDYIISIGNVSYKFEDTDEATMAILYELGSLDLKVSGIVDDNILMDYFGFNIVLPNNIVRKYVLRMEVNGINKFNGLVVLESIETEINTTDSSDEISFKTVTFEQEFKDCFSNKPLETIADELWTEHVQYSSDCHTKKLEEVLAINFPTINIMVSGDITQWHISKEGWLSYNLLNTFIKGGYNSAVRNNDNKFNWFEQLCYGMGWRYFINKDMNLIIQSRTIPSTTANSVSINTSNIISNNKIFRSRYLNYDYLLFNGGTYYFNPSHTLVNGQGIYIITLLESPAKEPFYNVNWFDYGWTRVVSGNSQMGFKLIQGSRFIRNDNNDEMYYYYHYVGLGDPKSVWYNGDFETGELLPWTCSTGTATIETETLTGGINHYVKLTSGWDNELGNYNGILLQAIETPIAAHYNLNFKAKISEYAKLEIYGYAVGYDDEILINTYSTNGNVWTNYTTTFPLESEIAGGTEYVWRLIQFRVNTTLPAVSLVPVRLDDIYLFQELSYTTTPKNKKKVRTLYLECGNTGKELRRVDTSNSHMTTINDITQINTGDIGFQGSIAHSLVNPNKLVNDYFGSPKTVYTYEEWIKEGHLTNNYSKFLKSKAMNKMKVNLYGIYDEISLKNFKFTGDDEFLNDTIWSINSIEYDYINDITVAELQILV